MLVASVRGAAACATVARAPDMGCVCVHVQSFCSLKNELNFSDTASRFLTEIFHAGPRCKK